MVSHHGASAARVDAGRGRSRPSTRGSDRSHMAVRVSDTRTCQLPPSTAARRARAHSTPSAAR